MDRYTGYTFDDQNRWTRGHPLRGLDDAFAFVLAHRHTCARVLVTDTEDYGVMETRQGELTFPDEAKDLFAALKRTFTCGSEALGGHGYSYVDGDQAYAIGYTGNAFEAYLLADVGLITAARSARLVGCLQAILDHQALFEAFGAAPMTSTGHLLIKATYAPRPEAQLEAACYYADPAAFEQALHRLQALGAKLTAVDTRTDQVLFGSAATPPKN